MGGALRVSQLQLLQPFLSILAAVPLLGEPLERVTLGFALAVVATVVAESVPSAATAPMNLRLPSPFESVSAASCPSE